MFNCECGRSYLSALALSNHKKSKHESNQIENSDEELKRKRGRPKKCSEPENSNYEEINYKMFFEKDNRGRSRNENFKIKNIIDPVFIETFLFIPNNAQFRNIFKLTNVNEHPLYKLIKYNQTNNLKTCDGIFNKYLEEVSKQANENYSRFVIKIILLFRECINLYRNVELENSILILNEPVPEGITDFTQFYDAEQIPELCNEFLTDFLETNEYFGIKPEYIKEVVPLIQHFCFWLYQNNFTSSRLSINDSE